MRYRMFFLAICIAGLLPGSSFAEKVWTSFTASDAVYDIAIQGDYVWCATANGPVRWDRRDMSYTVFNNIPDNRVNCMTVDSKENVWIGTRNGVYRLDPATSGFTNVTASLPLKDVSRLIVDPNGVVRAIANSFLEPTGPSVTAESGIYKYENKKWEELYKNYDLGQRFFHIGFDSNGTIWFDRGGVDSKSADKVYRMDATGVTEFTQSDVLPEGGTTGLLVQSDGTVWVGATGKVLRYIEGNWTNYDLGATAVTAFAVDSLGIVWAISESGLFRFVTDAWETDSGNSATNLHDINVLQVDASGTKWAGTSSGLYRMENGQWRQYTTRNRLPQNVNLNAMATDSAGNLWTATSDKLYLFNGSFWDSVSVSKSLGASPILDLEYTPDGIFWIKTEREVIRFDNFVWKNYGKPSGLSSLDGIQFATDRNNSVFLHNNEQYWRLSGDSWEENKSSQPTQTIFPGYDGILKNGYASQSGSQVALSISSADTILTWMGDWTVGLGADFTLKALIELQKNTFWGVLSYDAIGGGNHIHPVVRMYYLVNDRCSYSNPIDGFFSGIALSPDETTWIGMRPYTTGNDWPRGGGLYQYNFLSIYGPVIHAFDAADGLYSTSVVSVDVSPDGTVWAGTEGGLTRYGEPLSQIATSVSNTAPAPVSVLTNHPNPFNPSTSITFTLPVPGKASLSVYDITGQKVRTLVAGQMTAGSHSVLWDGRDDSGRAVSSGVYLSRLNAGGKYRCRADAASEIVWRSRI